jgi:hypothetical protein
LMLKVSPLTQKAFRLMLKDSSLVLKVSFKFYRKNEE